MYQCSTLIFAFDTCPWKYQVSRNVCTKFDSSSLSGVYNLYKVRSNFGQWLTLAFDVWPWKTINVVLLSWVVSVQSVTDLARAFQSVWCLQHIFATILKLYCRYLYTRPCMINHIWGLKQLWLQVNGHAWFHLQRLRWPVRNGEGAKNSKWKYMSPAGFEPTPRQSTTGKLQRLRPLRHEGLMVIGG